MKRSLIYEKELIYVLLKVWRTYFPEARLRFRTQNNDCFRSHHGHGSVCNVGASNSGNSITDQPTARINRIANLVGLLIEWHPSRDYAAAVRPLPRTENTS